MRVITMRELLDLTRFIEMKKKYDVFVDDLPIIILNRVLGITQYHDYISIYKEFRAREALPPHIAIAHIEKFTNKIVSFSVLIPRNVM